MYRREINPHFEQVGKRRKLTGYDGMLFDGDELIHCREYSSYHEAEVKLDALSTELTIDLCERGLIDELPIAA